MLSKGMSKQDEKSYLAAYILFESLKKKEEREFGAYIDMLTTSCNEFPVMYTDEELSYLNGSIVKEEIKYE